ncbi:uncharacterized protein N7459_008723 [Penicillium hispanicum]|uniref:uncharacterized protein n=1 Tax=Penicillium hispanicum TaxID=1080232 RepID=UPI00253FF7D6|nr:uncharacterized protein N7459_008723 [Penicillium hispanicum]KAJ5574296.1 hypothetical protein N7459_008723 [Penicillium hispanicum]
MPGVEVSSASVDSPGRPLLRSHKTLPRRGIVVPNVDLIQPVSPDQNSMLAAAPAPPLTPPGANQDEVIEEDSTPRKNHSSLSELQTTGLTPRRLSKPPTPDVTPPRTTSTKRPPLNQPVHFSSSSRAESFQTACESISSDGDMKTPIPSSQKTRRRMSSKRNASNGAYGKPLYAKDAPPSASQPHSETEYETGFESFDGDWASNLNDGSPTPLPGKRNPSKPRRQLGCEASADNDTLNVLHLDASLMREKSLRDRLQKSHVLAASPSMEQFREDIGWPSYDGLAHSEDPDSRRLSAISSTSTVEAMIIDSPKRAQRLLRHTEKRSSLRSASSPITRSEGTSTASRPESQHRLVHKAARISEQDRRSISSDISFSAKTIESAPRASIDIIPVVVVPERRSSLKSGPNSHASSKPGSQRSSRRPPAAPAGSVEVPRQKKRTMSDSVSARSRDLDSRGRPFGRPIIPPRSSSLSAPTSRNNSRATSLTSESLRSHTLALDLEMQKRREQQPVSPPRHNILGASSQHQNKPQTQAQTQPQGRGRGLLEPVNLPTLLISSEDMATLRPPSLPFTQWSIPSSSPGPIEIREATAVSLFAHNNRSLLLVEQGVPAPEIRTLQAFHQELSDRNTNPQTPDNPPQALTLFVDSPLKNPRPPPKPPISSKPLPALPTEEKNKEGLQDSNGRLGRRWGSVRRTWAARPRSDSFNTMTRSLSIRSAKNRKAGMEMDSRLHPFWRPRGFWEDISGSPKKGNSARQSLQNPDDPMIVNNSLGLPQQRVIFDGPSSFACRSPEMKRLFDLNASHGSLVDRSILRTTSPLYQHHYRSLGRWGLRLRSMSLRNVRNRWRRMRQKRDERKRAVRRETLKQSIGGPVYVTSSAANGVVQ